MQPTLGRGIQKPTAAQADLSTRLRGRQEEMELAAMSRLRELSDDSELRDPEYVPHVGK